MSEYAYDVMKVFLRTTLFCTGVLIMVQSLLWGMKAACEHYRRVARAAYHAKALDPDVEDFINKHCRGNAKYGVQS